ncbi:MAG TPA: FAD-dependent oxidoreductase [Polyangium sp.]|nr:FAD-dependent oxidoreductase [Polyangium sp.]
MESCQAIVVGAGIFGVSSALALRAQGYQVTVVEPGPIPHFLAESTDISKVVRADYGADEIYTSLMEQALEKFRHYNRQLPRPLFHETGVMFVSRNPMVPGSFEYESHSLLTRRGHRLERVDNAEIRRRFPAWKGPYVDGYFNPLGGWVESGKFVAAMADEATKQGVSWILGEKVTRIEESHGRVQGVILTTGQFVPADHVVIATGAWTTDILPNLKGLLRGVGQPVFHLRPMDPTPFRSEVFPVFGADISRTGYYGFPVQADGIVKIANHGIGRPMHPDSSTREVTPEEEKALREFLAESFPILVDAPIVYTRICVYGDSHDEHFWISRHPDIQGLVIAAGGSGHGFKFGPVIGDLVVDALHGVTHPALQKFRYRTESDARVGHEAARHRGDPSQ